MSPYRRHASRACSAVSSISKASMDFTIVDCRRRLGLAGLCETGPGVGRTKDGARDTHCCLEAMVDQYRMPPWSEERRHDALLPADGWWPDQLISGNWAVVLRDRASRRRARSWNASRTTSLTRRS